MLALIVIVVVVVLLVGFAVAGFNKLRKADVRADEALGGIDVQLTRRADLIPNLVRTVQGYATHERAVLDEVTAARTAATSAARGGDVKATADADARLQKAVVDVLAVAEAYPDLKASANFQQLQIELSETESALAFARQYYNDAAATLNTLVRTIPWMFFRGFAGVSERTFYDAPAGQDTPPTVQF